MERLTGKSWLTSSRIMISASAVIPFLDHNRHVGLSFYASDTSRLLAKWSTLLRTRWEDETVVIVLGSFACQFIRECESSQYLTRSLNIAPHKFAANGINVKAEYYSDTTRITKLELACFAVRTTRASETLYEALFI